VVIGLLGLTLAATAPVLTHFTTWVLGGGELPGWLWRSWWLKLTLAAITALPGAGWGTLAFRWFSALSYPEAGNTADLIFIYWPLESKLGFPAAYNLKVILILFANGCCAYCLFRYLSGHSGAAFLGAVATTFAPYFALEIRLGGIRQDCWFFLILAILFWLLANDRGRALDWALAGIFLALTAIIYWFHFMAMALVILGYLAARTIGRIHRILTSTPQPSPADGGASRGLVNSLIFIGATLLILLPWSVPYLDNLRSARPFSETLWLTHFPDLATLVSPTDSPYREMDNLARSLNRFTYTSRSIDYLWNPFHPESLPLAWVLLGPLLALARPRRPWFWLLVGGGFFLLTLGPYLKWGAAETYVMGPSAQGVRLPYVWMFTYVPFFSRLFAPNRFTPMMMVALGALVALNCRWIFAKFNLGRPARALFYMGVILLAAIQMVSRGQFPIPANPVSVPGVYQWLGSQPSGGVVEIPFHQQPDVLHYYQTLHQRRLLGGWGNKGTMHPMLTKGLDCSTGAAHFLLMLAADERDLDQPLAAKLQELAEGKRILVEMSATEFELLSRAGYRYLIIHERGCETLTPGRGKLNYQELLRVLSTSLGPPAYQGEEKGLDGLNFSPTSPLPFWRKVPPRPTTYRIAVFVLEARP